MTDVDVLRASNDNFVISTLVLLFWLHYLQWEDLSISENHMIYGV